MNALESSYIYIVKTRATEQTRKLIYIVKIRAIERTRKLIYIAKIRRALNALESSYI